MVASAALVEFDRSDLCKDTRSCLIISVLGGAADLIYQEWSGGPTDDEISAVPPIELLKRVENGLADF
jgi:hypothetical protein